MGACNDDPYELRLFAVFKSCLTEGQTELEEADLLSLCNKLHLDEKEDELKLYIRKHVPEKKSVSFQEFRDGLLTLLKTQGLDTHTDGDFTIISQKKLHANGETVKRSRSSPPLSAAAAAAAVNRDHTTDSHERKEDTESRLIKTENEESSTLRFISDCLGNPFLPKEIIRRIFERVDKDCDGTIDFEDFLAVFQERKDENESGEREEFQTVEDGIDWNIPTRVNTGLSDPTSLLSDLNLAELTSVLCDELKNVHDSFSDRIAFRSHLMLLRAVLILYQEELRNLNNLVDNLSSEKEKLRADVSEANERANSLAQEVDEYHICQEEVKRNLLKQIELRHSESIRELSNQLCSERESTATALKSTQDQLHSLRKDNHDIRNKLVNTLRENRNLETENEKLRDQIEKLKWSNSELLAQMKVLAVEHDEVHGAEVKQQEEVIHLLEQIKKLQAETTLLRDQNDELITELEASKSRDFHLKDAKEVTQTSQTLDDSSQSLQEVCNELTPTLDEERNSHLDLETYLRYSDSRNSFSCSLSEEENETSKIFDLNTNNLKVATIIKELKNILSKNKCDSDSCTLKTQMSAILNDSQSTLYNSATQSVQLKQNDFAKSIAFELECETRSSGSLRDFVVCKSGNTNKSSIGKRTSSTDNIDTEDISNQDIKNGSQSKSSLRDYPPRKEEQNASTSDKDSKEKEGSPSRTINNSISNLTREELAKMCEKLEDSLYSMKAAYEENDAYWAEKLEEERQEFAQEHKKNDETLRDLIAKIDELKNESILSPIAENYKLEQQYSDLEEEFEKWKTQMQNTLSEKDIEIEELKETMKSLKKSVKTSDCSIQVSDEMAPSESTNYIRFSNPFDVSSSLSIEPFVSSNEPILKMARYSDFEASTASKEPKDSSTNPFDFASESKHSHVQESHKTREVKVASLERHSIKETIGETTYGNEDTSALLKDDKCDFVECKIIKGINDLKRNDIHRHVCVDVNVLQNMNMKLQALERKKRQLQECFRQEQDKSVEVIRRILKQHQLEVSELQRLLRYTQENLQVQIVTSVEQADRLARADILIKDLYIENASLMVGMKRLEQHYHVLTGFNAESTSI